MILASNGILASTIQNFIGLLDTYPSASVAYSLRQLRGGYSGSAIRVRRTDATEQDFGFSNNALDTTALMTFVGTGVLDNGFITTWYDQSGNGLNLTQTTALNQPKIVDAGVLLVQGSKPTLFFDGVNDYIDSSSVTTGNPKSIFMPTKFSSLPALTEVVVFDSVTTNQALLFKAANNAISLGFGNQITTSYTATTNYILYSIMHNGTNSTAYVNSLTQIMSTSNLGTNAFNGLRIGAVRGTASLFYNGNMPEYIVYGSDQASNRTGIESNINSYYNIYQILLLDLYPSASAAYSVRKLRNDYAGNAIRVRRSSDNAEQDIGFSSGNLDTSSLLSFVGANNGFVTTWYDQSGNALNAIQTTAVNQPQIVSSGAVITENSKPTMTFDGTNDSFVTSTNVGITTNFSLFSLASGQSTSINQERGIIGINGFSNGLWIERTSYGNALNIYISNAAKEGTSGELPLSGFAYKIFSTVRLQNSYLKSFINATQNINETSGFITTNSITNGVLNVGKSDITWKGNIGEVILYASDQNSNLSGIRTNINTYYGIY
jgi:hypothetical protein